MFQLIHVVAEIVSLYVSLSQINNVHKKSVRRSTRTHEYISASHLLHMNISMRRIYCTCIKQCPVVNAHIYVHFLRGTAWFHNSKTAKKTWMQFSNVWKAKEYFNPMKTIREKLHTWIFWILNGFQSMISISYQTTKKY